MKTTQKPPEFTNTLRSIDYQIRSNYYPKKGDGEADVAYSKKAIAVGAGNLGIVILDPKTQRFQRLIKFDSSVSDVNIRTVRLVEDTVYCHLYSGGIYTCNIGDSKLRLLIEGFGGFSSGAGRGFRINSTGRVFVGCPGGSIPIIYLNHKGEARMLAKLEKKQNDLIYDQHISLRIARTRYLSPPFVIRR